MSRIHRFADLYRRLLPSPFAIAVVLTGVTAAVAWWTTRPEGVSGFAYAGSLLGYWEAGLWQEGQLVFAFQMMLMLVLGHVMALSAPVHRLIGFLVHYCDSTARAAALVTFFTVAVGLFNWGLALVFGAVFARKVAEQALASGIRLNYPVIGAAGYTGLLVWHGGFSGSSLTKVAEAGHLRSLAAPSLSPEQLMQVPEYLWFDQTVFSPMNITVSIAVLLVLPAVMWFVGKRSEPMGFQLRGQWTTSQVTYPEGAERLDHSRWFSWIFGSVILVSLVLKTRELPHFLAFFTPNNINLTLLALGLLLHGTFSRFLTAVDDAITGAAGILIQFPLYFGILGMLDASGLVVQLTEWITQVSSQDSYPIFTFASSALINVFVPSGGGQWAIQGPVIVQTCLALDIPLAKGILAMAYGDQLTNMLQPFWALPLLGITGLKAREILPYCLILLVVAAVIYAGALWVF
ncbi:MAG: short-chain fatty acid transporter [Leptolyngbya sp. SIO3F4]|nr:short-chain fatty acid transporter [Leptolyngbya sp. SIO3F4]